MTGIKGYIAERGLAEEMFRLAVEACPNGMLMVDQDGKMVMVNSEIENQFGHARADLIGQPVDLLVPERQREQHFRLRRGFLARPETRRVGVGSDLFGLRKDGSEFPVEIGLNPIWAGDDLLVLSVVVDISERKRMERLKEEFVSTVSHELRTPLTSIAGSLGLLVGQWAGKLPDSAARLLMIAHKNSQRLVRLINDILDIEKMESGRVAFNCSRVDLKLLLQQSIDDNRGFADGFDVRLQLDPASVDADVNADPDRLAQVVTNLLSNAIKFSPPSGRVLLGMETRHHAVRITVRDHGSGIPEEFKPHVFEKFAQADGTISKQKGGTGLGLSIVREIVERLGGEVGFDDAAGGGTVFHVDLPIWDGSAGGEIDVSADLSWPRVLLCEDDRTVATVVRLRLRTAGFAVDFAHTIDNAIVRIDMGRYAALLVDLGLGQGDGVDLILRIRAMPAYRHTPILVISGDPSRGRSDMRSAALDVFGWLGKPIDFARLIKLLQVATAPLPEIRPRILHVDADGDVRAMVAQQLRSMADVVSADSLHSARQALATDRIDLAVLDTAIGGSRGLDLLPDLRDPGGMPIPVVMFSAAGATGEDGQVQAALSNASLPLEKLRVAVRDRLALLPGRRVREVA